MNRFRWVTMALPVALSLAILALMANGLLADPVVDIKIDEGLIIILVGAMLSGMIAINVLSQRWLRLMHAQNMAQARAETAEEHRRFLNRLDHELKNPLMAIRAGLANLSGTTDDRERATILEGIDTQTQRLGHIVADLRKIAEIGGRPLEEMVVDLNDLLHDVIAIAQDDPQARARQITVTLPQPPASLPHVRGDADLLLLALHNLLGNALKFSRPGDHLNLRGYAAGDAVIIEVNDTGPGIPEAEQTLIWEELYRGRGAQGIPGSGIGLALVHTIVERHRGSISLCSAPEQGTTFTIQLPVAPIENTGLMN